MNSSASLEASAPAIPAILTAEPDVKEYLSHHSNLQPLISSIFSRLEEYFGPGTSMKLEIVTFPESGYKRLYAVIQTKDTPRQALQKLWQFEESWWLQALQTAGDEMSVALEYI